MRELLTSRRVRASRGALRLLGLQSGSDTVADDAPKDHALGQCVAPKTVFAVEPPDHLARGV
jgi:hypothetical protein